MDVVVFDILGLVDLPASVNWWLRSPNSATNFWNVNNNGNTNNNNATNTSNWARLVLRTLVLKPEIEQDHNKYQCCNLYNWGRRLLMIFDITMLYQAWKDTVVQSSEELNKARFKYNLIFNLHKLLYDITTGVFKPSPLRKKRVVFPKERIVQVPSIRDKIVQHAICDNYLKEKLSKPLIKETSACVELRGTHYAANVVSSQLHNYFTHYGNQCYVLKCDIKSYFATIPHNRIYKLIDRYVDDFQIAELVKMFVDLMDIGLALGLQQSQLLANLNLSELDHLCKEKLRAKYYGRYMDDFYIVSNDYDYLVDCWKFIDKYITGIGLRLNPKTRIFKNKFEFIGFTFYLTNTGKIIKTLSNKKRHSKFRHINKLLKRLSNNEIKVDKFIDSYQGWRVHALSGNCYKFVNQLDCYVSEELGKLGYKIKIKGNKVKIYGKNNQST